MKRKIKVLHVTNSVQFSGAENVVCQIINIFRNDDDYEMAYACKEGPIREALAERGITYYPMPQFTIRQLRHVIKAYAPDIIHTHDVRATVMAAMIPHKIKRISTIHVNDVSMRSLSLKVILFCIAANSMQHIFWVSKSCYEEYYFKKFVASKSSILVNVINRKALDEKMKTDPNEYPYDIIYVGRIAAQKDPMRLAEVLAMSIAQKKDLQAAIVGSGDLEDSLKARIKELGIEQNVSFLGFQSNPLKMLHDARVMILTSLWEGTPICALEAMALGVPIVSTPADGMRDLVLEGETGFLSSDNAVLTERIIQIIKDASVYNALSDGAVKRFNEISDIQSYKNRLDKVYRR